MIETGDFESLADVRWTSSTVHRDGENSSARFGMSVSLASFIRTYKTKRATTIKMEAMTQSHAMENFGNDRNVKGEEKGCDSCKQ